MNATNSKTFANPVELSQILINLLSNSLDAIELIDKRKITIKTQNEKESIKIFITDSGTIPIEIANKMMEPFFTTKPLGKWTGLGLAISLALAQNNGGHLMLNKDSQFTQFCLEIPLFKTDDEQMARCLECSAPSL